MKHSIRKTLAALLVLFFTMSPLSAAEVVTYYHNDHLGSPIASTDSSGAVVWQQTYDPWGLKITTNTDARGYTGNWLDEETGLADHKARWYTSSIGRFTAIDPVKWHESNIHSFNRYAYSGNNPYTNIDVDGDLFLSFHLNRRDMRTDHAMIAGQVGNVGAKTAMGLHSAGSAVGLVRGLSRSSVKMTLKGAEAAKSTLPKHTKHSLNQKINRQIKTSDELDAIRTPLVKMPVKFDSKGRPSQRSIGEKAEVAVNPDTKKIVSVNPTSSKKAARLKRRKE